MTHISLNPSSGETIKEFKEDSASQALKACAGATQAFLRWRDLSVSERVKKIVSLAGILKKNIDRLTRLITLEMGKPIKQSRAEIEKCVWVCEYFAQRSEGFLEPEIITTDAKQSYVCYEPLGVVLGVMPWNFPFWQVFRCAIPALCAGNTFVLKHSSNVPQCALALEEIFKKAGFAKGVFTTLLINSDITAQLIASAFIQGVSVTGSIGAGSSIAACAGKNIKKSVLELGGSDPFIVLEDADIAKAAEVAVQSRMINSGQSCIAAKRFIVIKKKAAEFERAFLAEIAKLKVGDPLDEATDIGPLARADLRDALDAQVNDAIAKGGKLLIGGKRIEGAGFFYTPTVISNARADMKIMLEETFGPVAAVVYVKDATTAIAVANESGFGLGASLWTTNMKRCAELVHKLQAGVIYVNGMVKSDPRLPFGGIKNSGYGRELSHYGFYEFCNIKSVVIN